MEDAARRRDYGHARNGYFLMKTASAASGRGAPFLQFLLATAEFLMV
jgi:hypothetical protein